MTATSELFAKAEIANVLALYAHALDRRQWKLLGSVFHDDAVCGIGIEPKPWRPWSEAAAKTFAASLAQTHHQLGAPLIVIEGMQAWCETYCTAYHRVRADAPPGGKFSGIGEAYDMVSGLRYADRFECRNGEWKIAHRQGIADWRIQRPARDGTLDLISGDFRGKLGDEPFTGPVIAARNRKGSRFS